MPQSYTPEFKKKIVRLHEEEGRTYKSITVEYGVSKASMSKAGYPYDNAPMERYFNTLKNECTICVSLQQRKHSIKR